MGQRAFVKIIHTTKLFHEDSSPQLEDRTSVSTDTEDFKNFGEEEEIENTTFLQVNLCAPLVELVCHKKIPELEYQNIYLFVFFFLEISKSKVFFFLLKILVPPNKTKT